MSQIAILKSTLAGHSYSVFSVAFHPTAPLLATGSSDNTAKLWRLSSDNSSATCVATLEGHSDRVASVAFHPTALLLATGSDDKTAKLWRFSADGSEATCLATLEGHSDGVVSVAFHPTAPLLATGSYDKTAKLWRFSADGSAATCVATLAGHTYSVFSVAFHPTAPLLATGSEDKTAKLWRLSSDNLSATCVATLAGHRKTVTSVVFHVTAPLLATGSEDKTAKLWRLSSDNSSATCVTTLAGHSDWVDSVTFHATAPLLATGSGDNTAKLWRLSSDNSSATCVATLEGHSDWVFSVAFHPTAPLLATGSDDNTAKIWELNIQNLSIVPLTFYMSSGTKVIKIDKNLLEPKSNSSNKSCPSFMPLYKKIMATNLDGPFRFEFEGQIAFDLTGLTRIVFDRLLPIYTNLFFEQTKKSTFLILKKNVDALFENTSKIIKLAKAAKSQIVLGINPELIDLLLSSNLKEYFSENKKQHFEKLYSNVNSSIQNNSFNELNNNEIFLRINTNENGRNRVIQNYKEAKQANQSQQLTNTLLSEIRLRKFLIDCGFSSWEEVKNMYVFIQKFWNSSNNNNNKITVTKNGRQVRLDLFVSELTLDLESFIKRIKIQREDRSEILYLSSIPEGLFQIYPAFHPLLDYILDIGEKGNENRKTFVKYVTGTEYSPAEILIKLTDQIMKTSLHSGQPFYGHSCSNTIDLYRKPKRFNGIITKNIINTQLKATTSNNSSMRAAE